MQHEIDPLDGILTLDCAGSRERHRAIVALREAEREMRAA
jgi:peptide deformylase